MTVRRERVRVVTAVQDTDETEPRLVVYFFTDVAGDGKHASLSIAKDHWGLYTSTLDEPGWWWPPEDKPFDPKAMADALGTFIGDDDPRYPWASAVAYGQAGGELIVRFHRPGLRQASIGLMRDRWWCTVPDGLYDEMIWHSDPRADTLAKPFSATGMRDALLPHTRLVMSPGEALSGGK